MVPWPCCLTACCLFLTLSVLRPQELGTLEAQPPTPSQPGRQSADQPLARNLLSPRGSRPEGAAAAILALQSPPRSPRDIPSGQPVERF